jgi:HK97 family phage portal protein
MRWPWQRRETHNIDKMKLWGTGADIGEPVYAGISVSQEQSLRMTTVYRCVRLISETLAALPADAVRAQGDIREPVPRPASWLSVPNEESTWFAFAERVFESLAMDGNAFILISARDSLGLPSELWTLNPRQVQVRREAAGPLYFLWAGDQRLSRFGPRTPTGDVLHIRLAGGGGSRGLSPLDLARQAIGLGLVTEKFGAKFFAEGQQLSGVIQLPAAEVGKSKEYIDLIRENWMASHSGSESSHKPGILTGGATWQQLSISPENAQFLETRRFQVEEIARLYGVPPHMVSSVTNSTSWGTGIEQQALGFARFTLLPWIVRFEQAFSQLLPRGQFIRLNQRGLIRADSETEARVITNNVLNGLMSRNEGRSLYDLPPVPGGDRYMVPANEQVLEPNGVPATVTQPPAVTEPSP